MVINDYQWLLVIIQLLMVINCYQKLLIVINKLSIVINGSQHLSMMINGHWLSTSY